MNHMIWTTWQKGFHVCQFFSNFDSGRILQASAEGEDQGWVSKNSVNVASLYRVKSVDLEFSVKFAV